MNDLPLAQLTIDGRAVTLYFAPVPAGTRCGLCHATSTVTDDLEHIAAKLDSLGIICDPCADNAIPGLGAVLTGLDQLINGLIVTRGQNPGLIYETLAGQVQQAIRGIVSAIGADPAFHETPIQIGRLTDRATGKHQFFWATFASEWDRFATAHREAGEVHVERFEFTDTRITDATAEWLATLAQEKGQPGVCVLVGSIEDGHWANWNLTDVPAPPIPA
ncbi:hypothetical protein ACPF8X_03140 [Streptomyces sp. G35A]